MASLRGNALLSDPYCLLETSTATLDRLSYPADDGPDMRQTLYLLILGIVLAAFIDRPAAGAEPSDASTPAAPLSADELHAANALHIYLMTFGPGDEPWEKFGHSAIRIVDDLDLTSYHDVMYNWGFFDLTKHNFYVNFLQGRMDYAMYPEKTAPALEYYGKIRDSRIFQQELNLSPDQKRRLQKLCIETDTEANRYYRYDYYRDNCSTRPRDIIDGLIGHRLADATKDKPSQTTFRFHTDRLDYNLPWLYVALETVLGHPVDQPLDRWEEMFLPLKLHDGFNATTVLIDGQAQPLVMKDELLNAGSRVELAAPPNMTKYMLGSGILIGVIYSLLGRLARRSRLVGVVFSLATLPWLLLMAAGGSLIIWGWFATDHEVARRNENALQVCILFVPLLVLVPILPFTRRFARITRRLATAVVLLSILGVLLKVLPMFYQVNWTIIALCMPANIGLALAIRTLARPKPTPDTPAAIAAQTDTAGGARAVSV